MNDATGAAEPGLERVMAQLRSVLIPGEVLQAYALQHRLFALRHRRVLLAATSGRLIVLTRRLLGGFGVTTIRWQDLEEVTLHVGILSAQLALRAARASDLATLATPGSHQVRFSGLRREQAQALYRICQAQDQAWREKRRVRELEELRARAGGIQVTQGPPGASGGADAVRRMQEAKQLLEAKLITDAEYEALKARILS
jgi:hypothetical protein